MFALSLSLSLSVSLCLSPSLSLSLPYLSYTHTHIIISLFLSVSCKFSKYLNNVRNKMTEGETQKLQLFAYAHLASKSIFADTNY